MWPSSFNYFQAALYLYETQTDLPLALTYIQKATANDATLFFQVYRDKDLGKTDEAIAAAKRSMQLSEKAENDDFKRLNQQILDELMQ